MTVVSIRVRWPNARSMRGVRSEMGGPFNRESLNNAATAKGKTPEVFAAENQALLSHESRINSQVRSGCSSIDMHRHITLRHSLLVDNSSLSEFPTVMMLSRILTHSTLSISFDVTSCISIQASSPDLRTNDVVACALQVRLASI